MVTVRENFEAQKMQSCYMEGQRPWLDRFWNTFAGGVPTCIWAIYHATLTNCFYSVHFPFQFKSSDMLNLTRITEIQLATFLFWKIIIHSRYDVAIEEHQIRHPVSHCFPPLPHGDAWSFVHTLWFFFSHLGKLHCIVLLLKVREDIEDWLQGYGVPWEKPSYIKALFRVNYFVFWKSYCRHPCCFYWSYRFSTGAFRVWLCFGDWHILFEFSQNSTD